MGDPTPYMDAIKNSSKFSLDKLSDKMGVGWYPSKQSLPAGKQGGSYANTINIK